MSIILTDAAAAIVKADVAAFKRDGKRYADYVAEMNVTVETLPEHVAAFRDAFKAACPKADGVAVKAYATKVRNGLRYHLPKAEQTTADVDYLARFVKAAEEAVGHGIDTRALIAALNPVVNN